VQSAQYYVVVAAGGHEFFWKIRWALISPNTREPSNYRSFQLVLALTPLYPTRL
jgi:hypothetical protein